MSSYRRQFHAISTNITRVLIPFTSHSRFKPCKRNRPQSYCTNPGLHCHSVAAIQVCTQEDGPILKRQFWKGESTSRTILIVTLRRGIAIVHPSCLLRSLWCTIVDGSNVTRSTRGCCISTNVQGICILARRCLDFHIKLQHSLRQLESRHDCRNNKAFFFRLGVNNHREGDC